jgi:tetratricopeptide (TPR) repeat protein
MALDSTPIQTLRHYADVLAQAQATQPVEPPAVLKVLMARDRVQHLLTSAPALPDDSLLWLLALDKDLGFLLKTPSLHQDLAQWRKSLQPPDAHWWWYPAEPEEGWNRLDWLWNGGSLVCLAAFASYMTAFTAKFAVGGFDLLKSFGLVGNGTVAVLILSSLTQSGQQVLAQLLTRLKVPSKYHSEVSFGASLLLLLSAVGVQTSLPHIGQFYYTQGETNFYDRKFILAEKQLRQSLELKPGYGDAHVLLGRIYEIQEDLEGARAEYNLALQSNNALAHSNLGRLLIADAEYRQAEALLTKGLSYAQAFGPDDPETLFVLHKNLGWAQLRQRRYRAALANLENAWELSNEHLNQARSGEVACILSEVFEQLGDDDQAIEAAQLCLAEGSFETALDHEWLIDTENRLRVLQNQDPEPSRPNEPPPSRPTAIPGGGSLGRPTPGGNR